MSVKDIFHWRFPILSCT